MITVELMISHVKTLEIHREDVALELRAYVSSCCVHMKLGMSVAAEYGCFQSSDYEVEGFVFCSQPLCSFKCLQAPELAQNAAKFS